MQITKKLYGMLLPNTTAQYQGIFPITKENKINKSNFTKVEGILESEGNFNKI